MTREQREAIKALVALEIPVSKIAEVMHMHRDSVKRVIDPEYAEMRREQVRINGRVREEKLRRGRVNIFRSRVEQDALRLAKTIPADERDLTGRLCGDPLSGRSALDVRGRKT